MAGLAGDSALFLALVGATSALVTTVVTGGLSLVIEQARSSREDRRAHLDGQRAAVISALRGARACLDIAWEIIWDGLVTDERWRQYSDAEVAAFSEFLAASVLLTDAGSLEKLNEMMLAVDGLGLSIRTGRERGHAAIGEIRAANLELRASCWLLADIARHRLHARSEVRGLRAMPRGSTLPPAARPRAADRPAAGQEAGELPAARSGDQPPGMPAPAPEP